MVEYEKIYEETIKGVDNDREKYADGVIKQKTEVLMNLQSKLAILKE
jgi:hypothetical protein